MGSDANSDIKIAHLGFIQNIINRMAGNSFLIKGFAITFVTTLYSYLLDKHCVQIIFIPIFLFWYLDSYFLYQEKLYRKLYEKVAKNEILSNEFSLNVSICAGKVESFWKVLLWNKTILPFYFIIAVLFSISEFLN